MRSRELLEELGFREISRYGMGQFMGKKSSLIQYRLKYEGRPLT